MALVKALKCTRKAHIETEINPSLCCLSFYI